MIITGTTQVAAASQSNNVLEGSSFEFVLEDSVIQAAMILQEDSRYDVQCLFQIGGVTVMQPPFGLIFPSLAAESKIPNNMYHNMIYIGAAAGERLFCSFQNGNTSTAANINWQVRIDTV